MEQSPYNNIVQIWNKYAKQTETGNYTIELEFYKGLFNFFQVGDFYYYIFNISRADFDFVSPKIKEVLGYDVSDVNLQFLFNTIHPEDQIWYVNFENEVGKFLYNLPHEKLYHYKVRLDLRMKTKNGDYKRMLFQTVTIEQHPEGGILRTLGVHTDITHLKPHGKPSLSFIGLNGEPSFIDIQIGKPLIPIKEVLTKREKEILVHIIDGKQNKEIAEILYLSKQTVDRHRKNMLSKNNFKNSSELIACAIKNGWI